MGCIMIEKPTPPNPLEAALVRDLATNNERLLNTRWGAGLSILVATAICVHALNLALPEIPLYLLGLFILFYNSMLVWFIRRRRTANNGFSFAQIHQFVIVQIALDWLSMVIFLHLTGGITSPGFVFFFLHVMMVTILLPGQSPYLYVTMAVGVAILIAVLEATGTIPHYTVIPALPSDLHTNPLYILAQIIFFATALAAAAFLTASIMARLRERDRQIAALFQTTQDISSTLNLSDVLERLARSAAQALDVPAATIRLLNEKDQQLTVAASYGLSQEYLDKGPIKLAQSELDQEVLSGHPVIIDEATTDERFQYPQKVIAEGIRSLLVVPISGPTRPLGLLRVYAYEPNTFTIDDADFVTAIARQSATAIENAMAHDILRKVDQERAMFVRTVTHELRSPVVGAQSLLGVLLRNLVGELTPKQRDIIERLNRRMDSLLALINDLLAFAATKSVDQREPLSAIPVKATLKQVMEKFDHQAEEKQITFNLDACEESLKVLATEEGLVRILDNLIGNAIKYTPKGGSVNVRLAPDIQSNTAVITVSDTGIGIPADKIDRLGEEFFRAPNAKEAGITGTGLGLAIVKQLIDRFDGHMRVESAEGKGTTFNLALSLAD